MLGAIVVTYFDFYLNIAIALTSTEYKYVQIYVQINEAGVPIIAGTIVKVTELITSVIPYQWTHEQLHQNYPHLSMSQIHSALAYYWDRKAEIDARVENLARWALNVRQKAGETDISPKLREQCLL